MRDRERESERETETERESEKGANLDSSKKAEISFLQIDSLKVNTELFLFGQKVVFLQKRRKNPFERKSHLSETNSNVIENASFQRR